jgi:hypothetical protein
MRRMGKETVEVGMKGMARSRSGLVENRSQYQASAPTKIMP